MPSTCAALTSRFSFNIARTDSQSAFSAASASGAFAAMARDAAQPMHSTIANR
jgi:hypothetical protein